MIALIDYGAGNVRSVQKALQTAGAEVRLCAGPEGITDAERIVLPGVGAFGDCMAGLSRAGIVPALRAAVEHGTPLLGICVGLQVLFEAGEELGRHAGLGLLPGRVVRFAFGPEQRELKIPHTGWNQIVPRAAHFLFSGLPAGAWAYFNHAYYGAAEGEHVVATTDYGGEFPSVVGRERILGIQFHPEKSQEVGLRILRNFVQHRFAEAGR